MPYPINETDQLSQKMPYPINETDQLSRKMQTDGPERNSPSGDSESCPTIQCTYASQVILLTL
jgi:hypothetical protein